MKYLNAVLISISLVMGFCNPAFSAPYPASSYYSLHQIPQTYGYTDSNGQYKERTVSGYKDLNNLDDPIFRCSKEGGTCSYSQPETSLGFTLAGQRSLFRVYIPPGSTAVDLTVMLTQPSYFYVVARLGTPPQGDYNRYALSDAEYAALPTNGFYFSKLRQGDCVGKNSSGFLNVVRDHQANINTEADGGWLYVQIFPREGSGYATNNSFLNTVNTDKFMTWFRNVDWSKFDSQLITATSQPTPAPVLSVSPTSQPVTKEAGTATFAVSNAGGGTMPWTAVVTSGGDWFTIPSGTSGSNGGSFTGTYGANTTASTRTATVKITAAGATGSPATITVSQTQNGTPNLSVSPTSRTVEAGGGSTTFDVSNSGSGSMPWEASVKSGSSWLSISPSNGTNSGTITANYTANDGTTARTGIIRLTTSTGGNSIDVNVIQPVADTPVISITPETKNVEKDAGTATFNVSKTGTGTINWSASSDSDWLKIISGITGTNSAAINTSFSKNDDATSRTGNILVTTTSGVTKKAKVIQAATTKSASAVLYVYPLTRDMDKNSGATTFGPSNSNPSSGTMNWKSEVISGGDWLTIKSGNSSGVNSGATTCFFTENKTDSDRTGTVRIYGSNADGSPAENSPIDVTVNQASGAPSYDLSVSPSNQEVKKDEGTTSFNVSNSGDGNMNWTASVKSGSWLKIKSGEKGTNAGTVTLSYPKNTETATRTATVQISTTNGKSKYVTVTQEANSSSAPILSVSPAKQSVKNMEGTTTFNVSNKGSGTLTWTAAVTSGKDWLKITSGSEGTNSGIITAGYSTNKNSSSRTATIQVFSSRIISSKVGTTDVVETSAIDVTVTQEAGATTTILKITPTDQPVPKDKGTVSFELSNGGTGNMPWSASITEGSSWLSYASAGSGTINAGGKGSIIFSYTENTGASRKATVKVTPNDTGGTPVYITVTQAAATLIAILKTDPTALSLASDAGTKTITLTNKGTAGTDYSIGNSSTWLSISPPNGTLTANTSVTLTVTYAANSTEADRNSSINIWGSNGDRINIPITQAGTGAANAILTVSPKNQDVGKVEGSTSFTVYNKGSVAMPTTLTITSGSDWLSFITGTKGTIPANSSGNFTVGYTANNGASRKATIRVAATGATNSPVDVTVTQEAGVSTAILSVSAPSPNLSNTAGTTKLTVSNTGIGNMRWNNESTPYGSWLTILPQSGTNTGYINATYTANNTGSPRTASFRVIADGATGSPKTVTVTQPSDVSTGCQATLDKDSNLHIPYLKSGTKLYVADLVLIKNNDPKYDPKSAIFKYVSIADAVGSPSCDVATLSSDLDIHIPNISVENGGLIYQNMEYLAGISKDNDLYFKVTIAKDSTTPSKLDVSATNQTLAKEANSANSFKVSNTGGGNLEWKAAAASTGNWLTIMEGSSGTNYGTVKYKATENTTTVDRSGTITITPAIGSPIIVSVEQKAGKTVDFSVTPDNQSVANTQDATTSFKIVVERINATTVATSWSTELIEGSSWLHITSGAKGTDSGTINLSADANTGAARTGTIKIISDALLGGFKNVTVTQAAGTSNCQATLDKDLNLHIPYLSHTITTSETNIYTPDFVYEKITGYPDDSIIFRLFNSTINTTTPPSSCAVSTMSSDSNIHIPDLLLADGITHIILNMALLPDISNSEKIYFLVKNYQLIGNTPNLSVSASTQSVSNKASTGNKFVVSNSGGGTMDWTADVTTSNSWITVTQGSGTNTGDVKYDVQENTTTSSRSAIIRVTAISTSSTKDVTVTQAAAALTDTLKVDTTTLSVEKDAGTKTITLTNKGTVKTDYSIGNSSTWLSISPPNGTLDANASVTLTVTYTANSTETTRNSSINIWGSNGDRINIPVTQAEMVATNTILNVSPKNQDVDKFKGSTSFTVYNGGNTAMPITITITSGSDWLSFFTATNNIIPANGKLSYIFIYTDNNGASRKATIRVTATGATNSPVDVTVTQVGKTVSECVATLDANYNLHIPYIKSIDSAPEAGSFWADFVYSQNEIYPKNILFKYKDVGNNSIYPTCELSTLSGDLKIHIPDVQFTDGSHFQVDIEHLPEISTQTELYFVVKNYEPVTK